MAHLLQVVQLLLQLLLVRHGLEERGLDLFDLIVQARDASCGGVKRVRSKTEACL